MGVTLATVSLVRVNFPLQLADVHGVMAPQLVPLGSVHDQLIWVTALKPLPLRPIVGAYGVLLVE